MVIADAHSLEIQKIRDNDPTVALSSISSLNVCCWSVLKVTNIVISSFALSWGSQIKKLPFN